MTGQILSFFRPEFCVTMKMTCHFFSRQQQGVSAALTLKALEQHKRMPRFFTDDNLITTLCSVSNFTELS